MSDSSLSSDSTVHSPGPHYPDDQLPPVEPPSAGFILQLFVIPGVIVVVIVAVWLMFSWIAHHASTRPEDVVQGLQGSGPARWQRANELADMLRNSRHTDFRRNSNAATQLAEILQRELTTATSPGGMEPGAVNLRYFICRAMGEFEVADGLEVLIEAATTSRDPREQWVRRGAIQAIAVLGYHLQQSNPNGLSDYATLEPTLILLANDENELIRSETAFALGRIGTPGMMKQLEIMVDDPHSDTRYNAAVALAQQGNAIAIETLAEMLDSEELGSATEEPDPQSQFVKRAVIMKNAMQGTVELARQNSESDLSSITQALQEIATANPTELYEFRIDPRVQAEAKRTLEHLQGIP
jgi:hypothetical protein